MIPKVPVRFLNWCVGLCSGVALLISTMKVWKVSFHPIEASADWFIEQIDLKEKRSVINKLCECWVIEELG